MRDLTTLTQTARDAAGGGAVLALSPAGPDELVWHAVVAGHHGRRVVVLDLALGTVEVHGGRRARARRRGGRSGRTPACRPRSRRPA